MTLNPIYIYMDLEYRLYSGKGTLADMLALYDFYTEKKYRIHANRISTLMHRYIKTVEHNDGGKKLFIKCGKDHVESTSTYIFPFESYTEFVTMGYTYNVRFLSYLIQESRFNEVIVHKDVVQASPQAVAIIAELCRECHKRIHIMGQDTEETLLQKLISDKEDASYVEGLLDFPTEICISTFVKQCNIKCRFCEQAYREIPSREVSFDVFKRIIEALPKKMFCNVGLTPYMEPLTSKKYLSYVEYALKERPDANIGFNTNGVLLTEEKSRKLIDMGLKYLSISLNMPDRESHMWFCGKDFFETTVRNIRMLHRLKQQKRSKYPKVTVQFLKLPPVVGNEEQIQQEWMPYCDYVYFRNVSAPVGSPEKLEELKQVAPDIIETQVVRPEGTPCSSMMHTCSIDHMGYYVPCCLIELMRDESGKRKYKFMEIGHVDDMDVQTAWKSKKWRQLRCWQLSGLISTCRGCNMNQASQEKLFRMKNGVLQHCYGLS